ncbi:MAG TPA: NADPH-dependent F420 reductase [Acidimicrobiales bacterium]|nr:NADPH-dependent F420 reductase [Acidimicrobiales bacterium]
MDVGIIGGTGPAGRALALRLAASGNRVVIGSRSNERAGEIVAELVGAWPTRGLDLAGEANEQACAQEIVVLATPWDAAPQLARDLRQHLEGKVLVSMVNALQKIGREFHALVPVRGSIAATVQAELGATRVGAAFQHLPARKLAAIDEEIVADVLICADDRPGLDATAALVETIPGLRALKAGSLASAGPIESLTAVLLNVNVRYKTEVALRATGIPDQGAS